MEQSLVICNECGSKYTNLYYLYKTDEYYCQTCNKVFSREEVFGFSWATNIIEKMNIDKQVENMVQESTDNLQHEIKMTRIFKNKARKDEIKAIPSKADELLEVIFAT